jgi:hypothetical protein
MSDIEGLIPDPQVAREFNVTLMTLWRWDHTPSLLEKGWPPKVKLGKRNYRHRSALETFKHNLLKAAIAEREAERKAAALALAASL